MSGDIDIPFNNDPASTSVETTSYTVPASSFAKVRVLDLSTLDFEIDSVVHIEQDEFKGGPLSTGVATTHFTNTTNHVLVGSIGQTGTATVSVTSVSGQVSGNFYSGAVQSITTATSIGVVLLPGMAIKTTATFGANMHYDLKAININAPLDYWVEGGILIEGTKFRVELYNSIT